MRPGRAVFAALLLTLAIVVSPYAARAAMPPSLGFEAPFLAQREGEVAPIRLEGRPGTQLVFLGIGVLEETDILGAPEGTHGLFVLTRTGDGQWRREQTFIVHDQARELTVYDLDRDGREDVVLLERYSRTNRLLYFRGTPDGTLAQAANVELRYDANFKLFPLIEPPGGLVTIGKVFYPDSLLAVALRWNEESRFETLWSASFRDSTMEFSPTPVALLEDGSRRFVVGLARDDFMESADGVGIALENGRWGEVTRLSVGLWNQRSVFTIERVGRREVYMLGADSLTQFVAAEGQALLTTRSSRIQGLPEGWRYDSLAPQPVRPREGTPGAIAFYCRNRNLEHAVTFAEVDPSGAVEVTKQWSGVPNGELRACLIDARGRGECLWQIGSSYFLLPEEPQPVPAPDLPVRVNSLVAGADVTGDGRLDMVLYGNDGQESGFLFLEGRGQSPWFETPRLIPLPEDRYLSELRPADLDGDGAKELLAEETDGLTDERFHVAWFWDGSTFRSDRDEGRPDAPWGLPLVGDFDGDGRDEAFYELEDHCELLGWNADGTQRDPVALSGVIDENLIGTGDFDGDGRDEIAAWRAINRTRSLWRVDVERQRVDLLGHWTADVYFSGGGVLDATGDARPEIVWHDEGVIEAWGFEPSLAEPIRMIPPRIPIDFWTISAAVDIDVDGHRELLLSGKSSGETVIVDGLSSEWTARAYVAPGVLGGSPGGQIWTDVDGDDDPDLVILRRDGIQVALNETLHPSSDQGAALRVRLGSRNPGSAAPRLLVRARTPGPVTVRVYDAGGRLVWSEFQVIGTTGWTELSLAPRPHGRALTTGVYFARVQGAGAGATQRFIVIR